LLGLALRAARRRRRVIGALAVVGAVTAVDVLIGRRFACATQMATRTITIARSPDEVRRFWASFDPGAQDTATFRPAPGGRGTEVTLKVTRDSTITDNDLRRFKQLMETGEVVRSEDIWR